MTYVDVICTACRSEFGANQLGAPKPGEASRCPVCKRVGFVEEMPAFKPCKSGRCGRC